MRGPIHCTCNDCPDPAVTALKRRIYRGCFVVVLFIAVAEFAALAWSFS